MHFVGHQHDYLHIPASSRIRGSNINGVVSDGGGIDCSAALYNYGADSAEKHQKANGVLIFVLGDGVKSNASRLE